MKSSTILRSILTSLSLVLLSAVAALASGGSVAFVGNHVIDYKGYCAWGSGYTGATVIIKRDGQEVYRTSTLTAENRVDAFYRDSGLSPGESHEYMTCCDYEGGWSDEISCPAYGSSATAGEVGGSLERDLEMSGNISLDTYIQVKPGATLKIDNATVSLAPDGYSGWISGYSDAGQPGYGTVQISNSTLSEEIRTNFRGSGNNIFTNNLVIGDDPFSTLIDIDAEANTTISGNAFSNAGIDIEGGTTTDIIQNSFDNCEIFLRGNYQGRPVVLIDNNEFSGLETSSNIAVNSADVSITNNSMVGTYCESCNRFAAFGISVGNSTGDSNSRVTISGNRFSGYYRAVQLSSDSQTSVTGNILSGNDTALYMNQTAAATLTGNTFTDNQRAIDFNDGTLSLSNNCLAGNNRAIMHTYSNRDIAAPQNWWGSATGPQSSAINPTGTGDIIYISGQISGTVNFIPWLTESNCQAIPTPPEPEPMTLSLTSNVTELPADGQSSAILTLSLTDEDGRPVSGAGIILRAPDYGQLSTLSGNTNSSGQLQVTYTAAAAIELSGTDYVELVAEYPAEEVTDSLVISFTFAGASIWAEPHADPYSSEMAIIPGDSRFPAHYRITLRDAGGAPLSDQPVTLTIADATRARLEAGGQVGRQVVTATNSAGQVEVNYVYLGSPMFAAPLVDTITIASDILQENLEISVSVGLNLDIKEIDTPQQDSGSFPKTLAMRMQLEDTFRPQLDLRAYLSALEETSGQEIGMAISTQWLNPPEPRFMDRFQVIFPNYAGTTPPGLYQGSGVINYADVGLSQVIIEALGSPNLSYGANTYPAITFHAAGNYWFGVYAEPILLGPFNTATDYLRGAKQAGLGRMFGARVLEEAETVFQSIVCSVKPTTKAQFVAHTLYISNPYFQIVPPVAALNLMTKASGIICDAMQGNYATAAITMASLGSDSLQYAYEHGHLNLTLEQFLKLGKLIKLNQTYSRLDNLNGGYTMFNSNASGREIISRRGLHVAAAESPFLFSSWPDDLELNEYADIIDAVESGELSADPSLSGWQIFGVLNDDEVVLTLTTTDGESFASDGIHVFLLPWEENSLSIATADRAEIHRYYRASQRQIYTATYAYTAADSSALLSLPLQGIALAIDQNGDGSVDETLTPTINSVDTTLINLDLRANQQTYHSGDTFTLSASLNNPGERITADIYFSVRDAADNLLSIPFLTPGYAPLVTNFSIEAGLDIENATILSFPVTNDYAGIGTFTLETFLTYPGTMDRVGNFTDTTTVSFDRTEE